MKWWTIIVTGLVSFGLWSIAFGDSQDHPANSPPNPTRPHILFVMADDMGWGETGYYNHPVLKTPNLDQMARNGLRFDRFYAGSATCSPTRASVLTGRANDRSGVFAHGDTMNAHEITLADLLCTQGYQTAHFGKWHLNGLRGPGVPILKDDPFGPEPFGFQTWISVTNFFDLNPLMSRMGSFEEFSGDSSEVIVTQALNYLKTHHEQPQFCVIWYGSPHSPFQAVKEDCLDFQALNSTSAQHYGEMVALDRSLGTLRTGLRELGLEQNTLIWFCSDNGGLSKIDPPTVGGLRGHKGTLYEGGVRVPAVMEWPLCIKEPAVTMFPSSTLDMLPTICEITGVPQPSIPLDGISLVPVIRNPGINNRIQPIPFRRQGDGVLRSGDGFKLIVSNLNKPAYELYDLEHDPQETNNLASSLLEKTESMAAELMKWSRSVDESLAGNDYPLERQAPATRPSRAWIEAEEYEPFLKDFAKRPEYRVKGHE